MRGFEISAYLAVRHICRATRVPNTHFKSVARADSFAASPCLAAMLFCSPILLRSHSKRLFVQLRSAAMTNFAYMTRKSPEKKNLRIALRKYDPGVNKHVMFYEARLPSEKNKKQLTMKLQRYIRWTGKQVKLLVQRVERAWEYGRFQKYFDKQAPLLTDKKGRAVPRMK
ncbi:ribosomal protein l33 [Cystoisospora suis]|uniref:Ribosomal protein l33 n=1 Tax=Cystoisospora suis TaxID=483139 RepID=A0A2C6L624_9APIC|nr:ribosomal protein l33 [Cystoisospora suis]